MYRQTIFSTAIISLTVSSMPSSTLLSMSRSFPNKALNKGQGRHLGNEIFWKTTFIERPFFHSRFYRVDLSLVNFQSFNLGNLVFKIIWRAFQQRKMQVSKITTLPSLFIHHAPPPFFPIYGMNPGYECSDIS